MYRFHDKKIDTALFMQLQDLASILSGLPGMTFNYAYGSKLDTDVRRVTAHTNWSKSKEPFKSAGLKTDILLRTLGTLHQTNLAVLREFIQAVNDMRLPKLAEQLLTLFEDIRLEEGIKHQRPGTIELFQLRRAYYRHYFSGQMTVNAGRGFKLDELYTMIYQFLQADGPDPSFPGANSEQADLFERLKPLVMNVFEAKHTKDITGIVKQLITKIEAQTDSYNDLINDYFVFPIAHIEDTTTDNAFDELTRTDPLDNDDVDDPDEDNSTIFNETFSTWHKQNENADHKQTFMQFELEKGTKTSLIGEGARDTEEGDQAMASIQGASGETDSTDYSNLASMPEKNGEQKEASNGASYGKANQFAVAIEMQAGIPSEKDRNGYRQFTEHIMPFEKRLANTISRMLEHKKNRPRQNLIAGRLSKKLTNIATDEFPRLFYKKNEEDQEIDAAFTLLVDCSASMMNKMDETKKGVILFHRVLKRLKIPHEIIGFWEEASDVRNDYHPNFFHVVHSFTDSLYEDKGSAIMQLEAHEDNRDGFSIRVARERLVVRPEKHQFLLVFSDGEPAAADYDDNGIIDTNLAVSETRRQHIDVIGLFLAEGGNTEQADKLMNNIYGRERIIVPYAEQLPDHFTPLLKKLLLKAM